MTQDQIILLFDLKASQERGAASMGCNQRLTIASELKQQGLIDQVPYGPSFYRINQRGLKVLGKAERPVKKLEKPDRHDDMIKQLDKISKQQTILIKTRNEIQGLQKEIRQLTRDLRT